MVKQSELSHFCQSINLLHNLATSITALNINFLDQRMYYIILYKEQRLEYNEESVVYNTNTNDYRVNPVDLLLTIANLL